MKQVSDGEHCPGTLGSVGLGQKGWLETVGFATGIQQWERGLERVWPGQGCVAGWWFIARVLLKPRFSTYLGSLTEVTWPVGWDKLYGLREGFKETKGKHLQRGRQ